MGMRRSPHQRELGARRLACIGAETCSAREVVVEPVWALEDRIGLVRTLLLSHEQVDGRQLDANHDAALAEANPGDRRSNERAIEAVVLAEAAHLAKLYASEEWAGHAMYLHWLMAMADELDCDPPDRSAMAAATPLAQCRSRGDCLDRPIDRLGRRLGRR